MSLSMFPKGYYPDTYLPGHPRAKKSGHVRTHFLRAEAALGKPLPQDAVVHHHTAEDLVICQDQKYHLFLEVRLRAFRACGHVNWRRCLYCGGWAPLSELFRSGTRFYHRWHSGQDKSKLTVKERLALRGEPMGKQNKLCLEPRHCATPECAKAFTPTREWQLYCEPSCREWRLSEGRVQMIEAAMMSTHKINFKMFGQELRMAKTAWRTGPKQDEK